VKQFVCFAGTLSDGMSAERSGGRGGKDLWVRRTRDRASAKSACGVVLAAFSEVCRFRFTRVELTLGKLKQVVGAGGAYRGARDDFSGCRGRPESRRLEGADARLE
jgi:hypothetical protein